MRRPRSGDFTIYSQILADPRRSGADRLARWHSRANGPGTWFTAVAVTNPVPEWPAPIAVAVESIADPAYQCAGADRVGERRCLVQLTLAGQGRFRDRHGEQDLPPGYALVTEVDDPTVSWWLPAGVTQPWMFLSCVCMGGASHALVRALVDRHGHRHRVPIAHPALQPFLRLQEHTSGLVTLSAAAAAQMVTTLLFALAPEQALQSERDLATEAMALLDHVPVQQRKAGVLASRLGVTREHLSRIVRQRTGVDLRTLLARQRIALASRLLSETDLPCKTIARRVGFASGAAFTRSFVRGIGQTPEAWRKLQRS